MIIQSWLKIIGGSALCAISMHSAAQLQAEPKVEKTVKAAASNRASSQMTKTTAKQNVVYAPASEVTRKFITEADNEHFDSATFLLQQGADINCQVCLGNDGRTLLMKTAGLSPRNGGANQLLSWLVNNGANARLTNTTGNTLLHYVFIDQFMHPVYWPDVRGNLRFGLGLGIDPNAKNEGGDTVLHFFAKSAKIFSKSGAGDVADYASLIAELVRAGAKLDEQNIAGRTPLMVSMRQCSLPIVRAYLHAGAAANVKDAAGQGLSEIAKANAIQSPTKECIEVANFFGNPQNIEPLSAGSIPAETALNSKPLSTTSGVNFPAALVADFQGVIKSSLQAQPVSAKGKIDEGGRFEYAGDNGVVMAGSFDASGPQLEGSGITRLPSVGGRQLTYPNGENEARVALIAKFDGQVLRGSYKSKFESGTFSLCPRGVVSAECTATADPLGALFKGLGGLLSGR